MGGLAEVDGAGGVGVDEVGGALPRAAQKRLTARERHHPGVDRRAPGGGPSSGARADREERERENADRERQLRRRHIRAPCLSLATKRGGRTSRSRQAPSWVYPPHRDRNPD